MKRKIYTVVMRELHHPGGAAAWTEEVVHHGIATSCRVALETAEALCVSGDHLQSDVVSVCEVGAVAFETSRIAPHYPLHPEEPDTLTGMTVKLPGDGDIA
ncbi:MAG TPA: hypothetical protein VFH61_02800 [Thermoleophilia bacterium]|nr:hypothetical protein [Thermoleophilia bacterium]